MAKFLKKIKLSKLTLEEILQKIKSTRDWIRIQKPRNKVKLRTRWPQYWWILSDFKKFNTNSQTFLKVKIQQLVHGSKEPFCRNYAWAHADSTTSSLRYSKSIFFISSETNTKQIQCIVCEPTFPPSENQSTVYLSPALRTFLILYSASKKNKGFCLLISFVNSLHTSGTKSICIKMFDYVCE